MDPETTMATEQAPADAGFDEAAFLAGFDEECDAPDEGAGPDDMGDSEHDTVPPTDTPPEGGETEEDAPADTPPVDEPADTPPEDPPAETQAAVEEAVKLTQYVDVMEGQCRDMYARVQMYEPIDRLAALQGVPPEEMVKQLADGFERAMIDGLCNDRGLDEKTAKEFVDLQKEKAGQGYKPYQPNGLPKEVSFDKDFAALCGMAPEAKGLKELPEDLGAYLKEGNTLPLAWFRHKTAALGKELAAVKQELAAEKQNTKNRNTAPTPKGGVPASGHYDAILAGFDNAY